MTWHDKLLKGRGGQLHEWKNEFIKRIWETERMPADWSKARLYIMYKKGDEFQCGNYWQILLIESCKACEEDLITMRKRKLASIKRVLDEIDL